MRSNVFSSVFNTILVQSSACCTTGDANMRFFLVAGTGRAVADVITKALPAEEYDHEGLLM
jgi:hypothetical protein